MTSRTYTDEEVVSLWRERVVRHDIAIDNGRAHEGGHVWHSIWAGFVCALDRRDLASLESYETLGLPVEMEPK